jgi:hypothetical protein
VACLDSPCHRKALIDKFGPHGQSTKPNIGQQKKHRLRYVTIIFEENKSTRAEISHVVGTNYCSCPRAHVYIISIIHSIANCSIPDALLSSLKLFQQSEVPRHYRNIFIEVSTNSLLPKALIASA